MRGSGEGTVGREKEVGRIRGGGGGGGVNNNKPDGLAPQKGDRNGALGRLCLCPGPEDPHAWGVDVAPHAEGLGGLRGDSPGAPSSPGRDLQ